LPSSRVRAPRVFRSFVRPPAPSPARATEILAAPALQTNRTELHTPEVALPVLAAPPLEINHLSTASVSAAVAAPANTKTVRTQNAGFSDSTAQAAPTASERATTLGARVSGTFGSAALERPRQTPALAPVSTTDFTGVTFAAPTHATATQSPTGASTIPAEVLSKPRPVYTEEARGLQIEGEVLLKVEFAAFGQVRVVRLIRGLGHGLDESAAAAAQGIRFRPALRAGIPVDSVATVHIVFQLAY